MRAIDRMSVDGFRQVTKTVAAHCCFCGDSKKELRIMRIRTNVGMQRVNVCVTCRVNKLHFQPERQKEIS